MATTVYEFSVPQVMHDLEESISVTLDFSEGVETLPNGDKVIKAGNWVVESVADTDLNEDASVKAVVNNETGKYLLLNDVVIEDGETDRFVSVMTKGIAYSDRIKAILKNNAHITFRKYGR